MKLLKKIDENFELFFLIILLIIISVTMMMQVIMRYVFNNALSWSEEISRYCLVWSTFFSLGFCIRYRKSLRITLVVDLLPNRAREIVYILVQVVLDVFYIWLTYNMISVFKASLSSNRVTSATQIPIWVIYTVPLIGFALGVVRTFQDIVRTIRAGGVSKVEMKERVDG